MNQDHIFVDFDIKGDTIQAIAAVRTSARGEKVLVSFAESGQSCSDFLDVMVQGHDHNFVIVGFNLRNARSVFDKQFQKTSGHELVAKRVWIDLATLAWPIAANGFIPSLTLPALLRGLDITQVNPGTLRGDCEAIVRCYWALMKRYQHALTGETVVRETIQGLFGKAKSLLGG